MSENKNTELKILENAGDDILDDMSSKYSPLGEEEVNRIFTRTRSKYITRKSKNALAYENDISEVNVYMNPQPYKKVRAAAATIPIVIGITASVTLIKSMKEPSPDSAAVFSVVDDSSAQIVTACKETTEASATVGFTPERTLEKAVDPESASKEDIFYMMLNTIFYFDKVSGTVMFNTDNPETVNVDDFQCSLSDKLSYSDVRCYITDRSNNIGFDTLSAPYFENICYCSGHNKIDISPKSKAYRYENGGAITIDDVIKQPDESRMSIADDGMPVYNMLTTPTNVYSASRCIQPQEITFGFLSNFDLWNIDEITTFNDRSCYVINGKASEDYGPGHNVADFKLLVDTQTGVILQYEGYDHDGTISDFMYTKDIKFEDNAKAVKIFAKNDFPDYVEKDELEY